MLSNTNAHRINAPHLPTDGSNIRPISTRSLATMPPLIHPTAVIHPDAQIHPTVQIGPYVVIGSRVTIGAGTVIGAHVVIDGDTQIGEQNQIFTGAVIGSQPQDLKYDGGCNAVRMGNGNQIREYVTINQATHSDEVTAIGDNNLLMAYSHVGHNCVLENHVIIANSVALAGHIHIESYARISGVLGVHQFVRIGKLAMIGGMARIDRDVPPFMLAEGNPARVRTINLVGLQRSSLVSDDELKVLKKAFRLIYRSGHTLDQAIEEISLLPDNQHLAHLQQFLKQSMNGDRGLTPGSQQRKRSFPA